MSIGRESGGPGARSSTTPSATRSREGVFVAIASGNTREEGNQPNVIGTIAPSLAGAVTVGAVGRIAGTRLLLHHVLVGGAVRAGRRCPASRGVVGRHPAADPRPGPARDLRSSSGAVRPSACGLVCATTTSRAPRWPTPHVSGFAALLVQQGITSPAAIEEAMKKYGHRQGSAGSRRTSTASASSTRAPRCAASASPARQETSACEPGSPVWR